ncbi:MAG: aminoglycoside phosphotransferase family protein [Bacillota bacterium]|nr:aminoglycoside phosphotransferase family protein [Bacillota bacterium]
MVKEKLGYGHVNETYLVKLDDGTPAYVLQRINTVAFKNPTELMQNELLVTAFLKSQGINTIEYLPFENGKYLFEDENGIWRKMGYIDGIVFENPSDLSIVEGAGLAFGTFSRALSDLDKPLFETIPDFHNTKKRLENLLLACEESTADKKDKAKEWTVWAEKNFNSICEDYNKIESAGPKRIIHNDTKINNIIFDKDTHLPLAIIDLDTVMMGITLYDFGDGARSIVFEQTGDQLRFNKTKYDCFRNAYLRQTKQMLTEDEIANMWLSTITITKELGIRFLEDYLNNNIYFNTSYEDENLHRAARLLQIAKEIE